MIDMHNTPCQRGCCWTPQGICAAGYRCGHHWADYRRKIDDATRPTGNRLVFSDPQEQKPQPDQKVLGSVLRPTFTPGEGITK